MQEKQKGVTKSKSKKNPYKAYIGYGKTFKHLGSFPTFESAVEARIKAEKEKAIQVIVQKETVEEVVSKYKEKELWFIRFIKAIQKKFNLPSSVVKVALAPLEKN